MQIFYFSILNFRKNNGIHYSVSVQKLSNKNKVRYEKLKIDLNNHSTCGRFLTRYSMQNDLK